MPVVPVPISVTTRVDGGQPDRTFCDGSRSHLAMNPVTNPPPSLATGAIRRPARAPDDEVKWDRQCAGEQGWWQRVHQPSHPDEDKKPEGEGTDVVPRGPRVGRPFVAHVASVACPVVLPVLKPGRRCACGCTGCGPVRSHQGKRRRPSHPVRPRCGWLRDHFRDQRGPPPLLGPHREVGTSRCYGHQERRHTAGSGAAARPFRRNASSAGNTEQRSTLDADGGRSYGAPEAGLGGSSRIATQFISTSLCPETPNATSDPG